MKITDKKLLKIIIIGILFVSIAGSIQHFLYDWFGENRLIGLISPINESTWEHIKLLFFPMLIYTIIITYKKKQEYPCITSALLFGILTGCVLIPTLFYTYSGILGRNITAIDISIFFISVFIAFLISYRLTLSCKAKKYEPILKAFVFLLILLFFYFTYNPPNINLFISP